MPSSSSATGLHWQVSQATSLMNIVVNMSTESGNSHQGIFMENGSGGYMGDLVFNGGKYGIWIGNQQYVTFLSSFLLFCFRFRRLFIKTHYLRRFTVRNISVSNAATAIFSDWNWGWTFQGVTITDCSIGFDINSGGTTQATQTTGAVAVIDAVVSNTPIFIQNTEASSGSLAGSLVINNAKLTNVPTAVGVASGAVVLEGSSGTTTIASWGQGNVYSGTSATGTFTQGNIVSASKPSVLLDSAGRIFQKTHPQYADYASSQFISVKSNGAKGDGSTDDTAALQAILNEWSGCRIIFFDAGTYIVTSTLQIPAGTQMVGEAWTVIAGKGSNFQNVNSPIPVIQVGTAGSTGVTEITDFIFKTIGYAPGAIIVEWNVAEPSGTQGGAGAWDTHIMYVTSSFKY
jgi:glucan 1,3-beta-glucosidase